MSIDQTPPTVPTARGRDYPAIRQFTIFLENRIGQLMEVIRRFEGTTVRILSMTISESGECAFARFLLSDPEAGREVFERAGMAIIESNLIGVELPDDPQPMLSVCSALLRAEVNLIQAYPLMIQSHGRPIVGLMVDNIDLGFETLQSQNLRLITEQELNELSKE